MGELSLRRRDGLTLTVEVVAALTTYQGEAAVLLLVADITGRKRAESERERLAREVDDQRAPLRDAGGECPAGDRLAGQPRVQDQMGQPRLPQFLQAGRGMSCGG